MKTRNSDRPKTVCPISRSEFQQSAKPVSITINGIPMLAGVKEFTTGSFGWYMNGKVTLEVGDKAVPVQIGITLTAINSKEVATA